MINNCVLHRSINKTFHIKTFYIKIIFSTLIKWIELKPSVHELEWNVTLSHILSAVTVVIM